MGTFGTKASIASFQHEPLTVVSMQVFGYGLDVPRNVQHLPGLDIDGQGVFRASRRSCTLSPALLRSGTSVSVTGC